MAGERSESEGEVAQDRRSDDSSAEREQGPVQPAGREGAQPGLSARLTLGGVRVIALIGVLALAVIAAAILVGQDVDGWIVGLVVGLGVQILTMFILFSRRFASRP